MHHFICVCMCLGQSEKAYFHPLYNVPFYHNKGVVAYINEAALLVTTPNSLLSHLTHVRTCVCVLYAIYCIENINICMHTIGLYTRVMYSQAVQVCTFWLYRIAYLYIFEHNFVTIIGMLVVVEQCIYTYRIIMHMCVCITLNRILQLRKVADTCITVYIPGYLSIHNWKSCRLLGTMYNTHCI